MEKEEAYMFCFDRSLLLKVMFSQTTTAATTNFACLSANFVNPQF